MLLERLKGARKKCKSILNRSSRSRSLGLSRIFHLSPPVCPSHGPTSKFSITRTTWRNTPWPTRPTGQTMFKNAYSKRVYLFNHLAAAANRMHDPTPLGTKLPLAAARLDVQLDSVSMNKVLRQLKSVDPAKRKRCRVHYILIHLVEH